MTEKRAGRELAKWVTVTLAVLLGMYVGAYYAMVRPHLFLSWDLRLSPMYSIDEPKELVAESNGLWTDFFAPIHWLDRRVRPHVWELTS